MHAPTVRTYLSNLEMCDFLHLSTCFDLLLVYVHAWRHIKLTFSCVNAGCIQCRRRYMIHAILDLILRHPLICKYVWPWQQTPAQVGATAQSPSPQPADSPVAAFSSSHVRSTPAVSPPPVLISLASRPSVAPEEITLEHADGHDQTPRSQSQSPTKIHSPSKSQNPQAGAAAPSTPVQAPAHSQALSPSQAPKNKQLQSPAQPQTPQAHSQAPGSASPPVASPQSVNLGGVGMKFGVDMNDKVSIIELLPGSPAAECSQVTQLKPWFPLFSRCSAASVASWVQETPCSVIQLFGLTCFI